MFKTNKNITNKDNTPIRIKKLEQELAELSLTRKTIESKCEELKSNLLRQPTHEFIYNNQLLNMNSVWVFDWNCKKYNNFYYNTIRETIICAIINHHVPEIIYQRSPAWFQLQYQVNCWLSKLNENNNSQVFEQITATLKAGRQHNYDFEITINGLIYPVEFKFNCDQVNKLPQFVSLSHPEKYMNMCYTSWFYDHWLDNMIPLVLNKPDKQTYLKQIHKTNPECVHNLQKIYYQGCPTSSQYTGSETATQFYKRAKQISQASIQKFISIAKLDLNSLNKYLAQHQTRKFYMLYNNKNMYYDQFNSDDLHLVSYQACPEKQCFYAYSQTGTKYKILLRWKNGNGIALPALQISVC